MLRTLRPLHSLKCIHVVVVNWAGTDFTFTLFFFMTRATRQKEEKKFLFSELLNYYYYLETKYEQFVSL
jgi:hypothetical protein